MGKLGILDIGPKYDTNVIDSIFYLITCVLVHTYVNGINPSKRHKKGMCSKLQGREQSGHSKKNAVYDLLIIFWTYDL